MTSFTRSWEDTGGHIRVRRNQREYRLRFRFASPQAHAEALCEDIFKKEKEDDTPLEEREEYLGNYLENISADKEVQRNGVVHPVLGVA